LGECTPDIPDDRDEEEERCDDGTSSKGCALLACKSVRALDRTTNQHFQDERWKEKGERIRTRDFKPKDDGQYAREQNPEKRHGDDADADGKTATEPGTLENEVQDATTHGVVATLERRYVSVAWRFRDRQRCESR